MEGDVYRTLASAYAMTFKCVLSTRDGVGRARRSRARVSDGYVSDLPTMSVCGICVIYIWQIANHAAGK